MEVSGVGGGVRNSSGHWRMECRQVSLEYYRLQLQPGYKHQYQDCMVRLLTCFLEDISFYRFVTMLEDQW